MQKLTGSNAMIFAGSYLMGDTIEAPMGDKGKNDKYSEQETVARREAALKRMLSTPHKPHKPIGKKNAEKKKRLKP